MKFQFEAYIKKLLKIAISVELAYFLRTLLFTKLVPRWSKVDDVDVEGAVVPYLPESRGVSLVIDQALERRFWETLQTCLPAALPKGPAPGFGQKNVFWY